MPPFGSPMSVASSKKRVREEHDRFPSNIGYNVDLKAFALNPPLAFTFDASGRLEPDDTSHKHASSEIWWKSSGGAETGAFIPIFNSPGFHGQRCGGICVLCADAGRLKVIWTGVGGGTRQLLDHSPDHDLHRSSHLPTMRDATASPLLLWRANRSWAATCVENGFAQSSSEDSYLKEFVGVVGGEGNVVLGSHAVLKEDHFRPMYAEARRDLKSLIQDVCYLSAQVDFWKAPGAFQHSYIGFVLDGIQPFTWEKLVLPVCISRAWGTHSSSHILRFLDDVGGKFGVRRGSKLVGAVADNALRSFLDSCGEGKASDSAGASRSPACMYSSGCACHTINLAIDDLFEDDVLGKDGKPKTSRGSAQAKALLLAVHDAFLEFKRTPIFAEVLEREQLEEYHKTLAPMLDVSGRWYSRYLMLERALLVIPAMVRALADPRCMGNDKASPYTRQLLSARENLPYLLAILKPAYDVSKVLEANDAHIGMLLGCVSRLEKDFKV